MKRLLQSLACVSLLAVCSVVLAQTQDTGESITAPFSDPSRPGVLHVALISGSIFVKASDRKDVIIVSRSRERGDRAKRGGRDDRDTDASPGLKRLAQQPS